jgi:hypothetical protein
MWLMHSRNWYGDTELSFQSIDERNAWSGVSEKLMSAQLRRVFEIKRQELKDYEHRLKSCYFSMRRS